MAHYLIVAHQTSESRELLDKVQELIADDASAEFDLLVPATPAEHLLTWSEGESAQLARHSADLAKRRLEAAGARVDAATVGDPSPVQAIDDELRRRSYDAIIICTLSPGVSRWLKLDTVNRAKRKFDVPIIHIVAAVRQAERTAG